MEFDNEKPWINMVAIRLADEGVPVNAIARGLRTPSGEIRKVLNEAYEKAYLICVPRDDWPRGSTRDHRLPDTVRIDIGSPEFNAHMVRKISGLTPSTALMVGALIKRPEMTRAGLHSILQRSERPEETGPKIVDVNICKIRNALRKNQLAFGRKAGIENAWGIGYYMTQETKNAILERVGLNKDGTHVVEPLNQQVAA